jgi:magnesium chelatase subunit D
MSRLADASLAASLFAVDPTGIGGVCIRSPVHPVRDQWLQVLRGLMPVGAPMRRIPFNIADARLLGGLDLAASLHAGKPVAQKGVLAESDGGVLIVSMADRLSSHTAAGINAVLDVGEAVSRREGVSLRDPARVGVVALDESMSDEDHVPASLLDRLAFILSFDGLSMRAVLSPAHDAGDISAARRLLPKVTCGVETVTAICATATALGVGSPRMSVLALRVALAAAALCGRHDVREDDAVLAASLVLAPRAAIAPPPSQAAPPQPSDVAPPAPTERETAPADVPREGDPAGTPQSSDRDDSGVLQDVVLAAARASIPSGLLERLRALSGPPVARRPASGGRSGAQRHSGARGRPYGVRSGTPGADARLNVIETLRAAAPWQRLRGQGRPHGPPLKISRQDFRVTRYRQRARTLTIFAVDASGSSALHRLAEAKGAVELLLAECYVRRDQVAVVAFRGRAAEILLPPTRSLVRAKRSLADMAGGGGTPLAAAIDTAAKMAMQAQRRGETPTIVMLSDGRANVLRDGTGGRDAAQAEALRAASAVHSAHIRALFVDTSPRPSRHGRDLAARLNARYIPLPFADARALLDIVKTSRSFVPDRLPT